MFEFWKEYREMEKQLASVQTVIESRLKIKSSEIEGAVQTFVSHSGKMVRPALFLLFAGLTGKSKDSEDPKKLNEIAASLELLHLATLIHDDIIDDADTRRKVPTIQAQLGKDTAVYTGDFVYTVYFQLLIENLSGTPYLAQNARSMKKILQGELIQKENEFKPDLKVRQYYRAISGKTSELIALACSQGAYFGGLDRIQQARARRIGSFIGFAFQIYDDILNFSLDKKNEKPILTDVIQGIFTLPLLIAKDKAPAEIDPYLAKAGHLNSDELVELAQLVKSTGGLDQALEVAHKFSDKAIAEIKELPKGSNQKILLEATKKLLKRTY